MDDFSSLYRKLDASNSINHKVQVMVDYFKHAGETDKLWAIYILLGNKISSKIGNSTLWKQWAAETAEIPDWLFQETYNIVGDLAETIALILPQPVKTKQYALGRLISILSQVPAKDPVLQKRFLQTMWLELPADQRFPFMKILTGSLRVGVSKNLVLKALAIAEELPAATVSHLFSGNWHPDQLSYTNLLQSNIQDLSKPYPFCLAYPIGELAVELTEKLGSIDKWQVEYKWDGIRCQLVKRKGQIYLWSRGEELVTETFPELVSAASHLPSDLVLDGEILAFKDNEILSFSQLQRRLGRKVLTRKSSTAADLLQEVPVIFRSYDLLEIAGDDIRQQPFASRRRQLEEVSKTFPSEIDLSETINTNNWADLLLIQKQSRSVNAEGVMIKRLDSVYHVGRKVGDWWKWKVDPFSIDAVLIYAQRGHGRRANLYTDYTFAVWTLQVEGKRTLVPVTKAYSGLTDAEIEEVDKWVKQHTRDKFGPVRSVDGELVFEIGFEGIQASGRHKSGVALRFPRILRWRKDKPAAEADDISTLQSLLK